MEVTGLVTGGLLRVTALVLLAGGLGACASSPPAGLEAPAENAPRVAEVRAHPERFLGADVRWGGEILGVANRAESTEVEIYARPLRDNGEPRPDGGDAVRFIARVEGFLDPAEYAPQKRMTVRGRVDAPVTRPVGEYPYRYPVVAAEHFHLWPVYQDPEPAYWRYPYYDPWWPWGPWGPHRYSPYWW